MPTSNLRNNSAKPQSKKQALGAPIRGPQSMELGSGKVAKEQAKSDYIADD